MSFLKSEDGRVAPARFEWLEDHSGQFGPLRSVLVTPAGLRYRELRSGLEPRWSRVWADLGGTAGAVVLVPIIAARFEGRSRVRAVLVAPIAALVVGTAVHRLGHFLHEGAHFNVAPGHAANDLVTNAAVGVVVLTDVRAYRPIHLAHHRRLGQPDDPERSYFEALDARFVMRGLFGARVAFALRQRLAIDGAEAPPVSKAVPIIGAVLHAAVVLRLACRGRWGTAFAWAVGVGGVYPLLNSTRQLLEHRDDSDRCVGADVEPSLAADAEEGPGAETRMFTKGPLSSIIGGAGFNRHLLHHWDASVSYTRLRELEQRLQPTAASPIMSARDSTYSARFRRMWRRA